MRIIPSLVLVLSLALISPRTEAQAADVQAVISDQIAAFEADDFARAFTYASPTIQGIFGDEMNFGRMVRNGFPMVWRPADVRYLGGQARGPVFMQDVMIKDAQGRLHILEYEMIEGEMGWKINGVRVKPATPGTA